MRILSRDFNHVKHLILPVQYGGLWVARKSLYTMTDESQRLPATFYEGEFFDTLTTSFDLVQFYFIFIN